MSIERIILVAPAAPGSKGDEGMLRGALTLFAGLPVVVLNPEVGTSWRDALEEGAKLTEVTGPIRDFQTALRPGDLIFAIGADVVDGSCGLEPAFARLDLMAEALRLGLPTLVTCSFRSQVDPAVLQALCLLRGIRFLIRDVHSLENFQRQTGLAGEFFPDLSFFKGASASPLAETVRVEIAKARAAQRPVIGVNFAEHSFRSFNDALSLDQRRHFVETVMGILHQGHPEAFFVLFSNDSRSWENHPSDASYSLLASHWICSQIGEGRHAIVPDAWGYGINMALLGDVDLVITGRMHLSLAAFQAGTLPFVLMGEGKGYSSVDKMRGAFASNMGTTKAVITDLSTLGARITEVKAEIPVIAAKLVEAAARRAADCAQGRETIGQLLTAGLQGNTPGVGARAMITAYQELRRQSAALATQGDAKGVEDRAARETFSWLLAPEAAGQSPNRGRTGIKSPPHDQTIALQETKALTAQAATDAETADNATEALQEAGQQSTDAGRNPHRSVHASAAIQARTWNMEPPRDPLLALALPGSRHALDKLLEYRSHHLLAAFSGLLSAQRVRRSAGLPRQRLEDPARQRRILVADYRIPRSDVSAGDRATFGLIADLLNVGFAVTFLPTDMAGTAPYRQYLMELGVEVISSECGYAFAEDYLRAEGHKFGAFYLIRVEVAWALLATARSVAPGARVIFHAPDLCHLREMRGARLSGDPVAIAKAETTRARETAIMQAADHVVLVSPAERPFLTEIVPQRRISVFPALYSPVLIDPPGFTERSDLFFLGGFKHLPNIDAVTWFVDKIWPRIHAARPDITFHILGAEAPPEVIALGNRPGVRFLGYVADLDPMIALYRLSVAPLRYGAGIKGKLGAAMGEGVPCVSTTIGAEGMGIIDGRHALVRDTAEGFAEAVLALYDDQTLWEQIAAEGRRLVEDRFGLAANRASFYRALGDANALPLDAYVATCKQAPTCALPAPDASEAVDVSIIIPVHNQWAFTRDCLVSVERAIRGSGLCCEVILADDASSDETRAAADFFPGLRVVRQEQNLGFLRNCNAAAAEARGAALLFLNNHTIVLPGWLTDMVRILRQEPSAGIVGSKLLYLDGTIQGIGAVLFTDSSARNLGRGKSRHAPLFSFDREVDYATSTSILVRRSLWEDLGGFDTRFAPAYCEDSDLAMAARDRGLRVICAAGSEVVHFEHGTYGEASAVAPKALALANGQKLRQKWASQFETGHLPPGTQPEIAAAHAERQAFSTALTRRATGKLNILYFSPFPSHPDNHGNQATIQSFGRRFQKMGHKVHFALLQSTMFTDKTLAQMRAAWDSITILANSHPLSANGQEVPFDAWYQPGLGEDIRLLCEEREIDVVFCSYIFQSKLLDFVPSHVLKVIDTHDKMGDRYEMLRQKGQPLEFFSCSPQEEGAYLRRADLVVARRAEEAAYFDSVSGRKTAIVIPHVEEPRFIDRAFERLEHVGLVASANRINLAITLDFLKSVEAAREASDVPLKVHIAGQVRDLIPSLPPVDQAFFSRTWVSLHGFVADIGSFYRRMDVVVSPVTMGTGINVKTVQAMAFGMPLLTTAWGSKGIETGEPHHLYPTVNALVAALLNLARHPKELEDLADLSRRRYMRFLDESLVGFDILVERARSK